MGCEWPIRSISVVEMLRIALNRKLNCDGFISLASIVVERIREYS